MKRVSVFILGLSLFWCSCQNEDSPIFSKSADDRINEKLKDYLEVLKKPKYGWKAAYYPDSAYYGGWFFWLKFGDGGVLSMLSDYDGVSYNTPEESRYRVSMGHFPSLVFETYNYIHDLSNPGFGTPGVGFGGDFEFYFSKVVGDTVYLRSHVGNSILKLVPAEQGDMILDKNYYLNNAITELFNDEDSPYFKNLSLGETNIEISYSNYGRKMSFRYQGENGIEFKNLGISFVNDGIVLSEPIKFPKIAKPISKIELTKESSGIITSGVSELGLKGTLVPSNIPAVPYLDGVKVIKNINVMAILSVSPSLSSVYKPIKKVPYFKTIQGYFGAPSFKGLSLVTSKQGTLSGYFYNLNWNFGSDGILKATYAGTSNGAVYEALMKPLIDKFCNPEGFTVIDVVNINFMGMDLSATTIVSRQDSRDWIMFIGPKI